MWYRISSGIKPPKDADRMLVLTLIRLLCLFNFYSQVSNKTMLRNNEKTVFLHMRNKDADQLRGNREAD